MFRGNSLSNETNLSLGKRKAEGSVNTARSWVIAAENAALSTEPPLVRIAAIVHFQVWFQRAGAAIWKILKASVQKVLLEASNVVVAPAIGFGYRYPGVDIVVWSIKMAEAVSE